jgi:hypothetical protein
MRNKVVRSLAGALVSAGRGIAQVDYGQDNFTDKGAGNANGANAAYELYGTEYRQVGSEIILGISSNLSFGGAKSPGVFNGTITWGYYVLSLCHHQDFAAALSHGRVYGGLIDTIRAA